MYSSIILPKFPGCFIFPLPEHSSWCSCNTQYSHLRTHRRENVKSYIREEFSFLNVGWDTEWRYPHNETVVQTLTFVNLKRISSPVKFFLIKKGRTSLTIHRTYNPSLEWLDCAAFEWPIMGLEKGDRHRLNDSRWHRLYRKVLLLTSDQLLKNPDLPDAVCTVFLSFGAACVLEIQISLTWELRNCSVTRAMNVMSQFTPGFAWIICKCAHINTSLQKVTFFSSVKMLCLFFQSSANLFSN
jgi:hypothetical protein